MAEDRHIEGQQMRDRLGRLATQWSQGRVTLKQIVGLNEEELFAIGKGAPKSITSENEIHLRW